MKEIILTVIILLSGLSFIDLDAQMATTVGGNKDDIANSILQTKDGNYIVSGITRSLNFQSDPYIWITLLNSKGEFEWQKYYGTYLWNDEICLQRTNDGGYVVGGFIDRQYRDGEIWIMKLSPNGEIEWQKKYWPSVTVPFLFYFYVYIFDIQQTFDGGYIASGSSGPDAEGDADLLILKLSNDGTIEWNKTYGGSEFEKAFSIQQTIEGGYIVAGECSSFGEGDSDIWILKLASDGSTEWQKPFGENETESAYAIQQTTDGGYIVAGNTSSYGAGQSDFWVLKLHSEGYLEWDRTYGGSKTDNAISIQQTFGGGYIVAGDTQSFGAGKQDIWILKLDIHGDIEWQKTYGGSQDEEASSIQQIQDGGYILAGSTSSYGAGGQDFLLLKLSMDGEINPSCTFIQDSKAEVYKADLIPKDTNVEGGYLDFNIQDSGFSSSEMETIVYSLCLGQQVLNITASSGGTTDPQPAVHIYDYAERVSIEAIPDTGYKFTGWSGDISSTKNTVFITIDSDKALHANFELVVVEDIVERMQKFRCFIATSVYGTSLHPYVQTLQDYRDKYLMSSKLGRRFVSLYCQCSPQIAEIISKHKILRIAFRIWLFPLVLLSYSMVHLGPVMTSAIFCIIIMTPFLCFRFCRRKIE